MQGSLLKGINKKIVVKVNSCIFSVDILTINALRIAWLSDYKIY